MAQNYLELDSLTLEQIIDRDFLAFAPDTPVMEAIAAMSQAGKSCVLVRQQQLVGIFTKRDVVELIASQIPLETTVMAQVMTTELITLPSIPTPSILTVVSLLRQHRISHLPIIDDQGKLVGIVTSEGIEQVLDPVAMYNSLQLAQQSNQTLENQLTRHTAFRGAEIALRESEERFRTCVENMLDGLAIFSAIRGESGQITDFRYEYINQAGCELNHMSREQIMNKTLCQLLPNHRETGLIEEYSQVVETGQPLIKESLVYTDNYDGKLLSRAFYFQATKLGDGFAVAWRDITARKQTEDQVKASLAEKEVLLREIHHRVKNNLNIIHSLLNMQSRIISDEKLKGLLSDSQRRLQTMALIHEQLYQSQDLSQIDFAEYIHRLVGNLLAASNPHNSQIRVEIQVDPIALSLETAIPTGLIINELLTNALKHGFPNGQPGLISVEFNQDHDEKLHLVISDNGVGLPPELNLRQTASLGMRLVHILARQLRATFEVVSKNGVHFQLSFTQIP